MKKVLFFILLLWCPFSIVSAQFVNFGQDRPSLRWKQIKTDDFQIIYPDFFEENAQKAHDHGRAGGRDGRDVPSACPRGRRARGGYLHPQAHEPLYGRDEPFHGVVVQKLARQVTNAVM